LACGDSIKGQDMATKTSSNKADQIKGTQAKQSTRNEVNLDESSVYGKEDQTIGSDEDVATETTLDRLEAITGGADDDPVVVEGDLAQDFDELDASTDEEVDALKVNLLQDDENANVRDGSGRVVDDIAEEQIAKFTEVGRLQPNLGGLPVAPGHDDTSKAIRQHHPSPELERTESVVEGSLDEPRDEAVSERKVDDGTAA
jgi:hypothetical protein